MALGDRADTASPEVPSVRAPRRPEVILRLEFDGRAPIDCVLQGMDQGFIHVLSCSGIPESTPVRVHFDLVTVMGKVDYSRPKKKLFRISIKLDGDQSGRREPRFPLSDTCTAVALADDIVRLRGRLTDISASGLGLLLDGPIGPGTALYVETGALLIAGESRYCRSSDGGYHAVGVQIVDIFSDSRGQIDVLRRRSLRHRLAQLLLGRRIDLQ